VLDPKQDNKPPFEEFLQKTAACFVISVQKPSGNHGFALVLLQIGKWIAACRILPNRPDKKILTKRSRKPKSLSERKSPAALLLCGGVPRD
jgi:hypothetical protein